MKHMIWFWLPPIGYMIAIFSVSNLSNPQIGGETPDYVLHALEYFVLALFLMRLLLSLSPQQFPEIARLSWQQMCLLGMMMSMMYGISDEIHQYFIPGRHCSLHDVFADAAGSALAFGIAFLDMRYVVHAAPWLAQLRRFPRLYTLSYAAYRHEIV